MYYRKDFVKRIWGACGEKSRKNFEYTSKVVALSKKKLQKCFGKDMMLSRESNEKNYDFGSEYFTTPSNKKS